MTFETFPYTNYQELNVDWVLREIKSLKDRVDALENTDFNQIVLDIINQYIEDGTFEEIFNQLLVTIREDISALEVIVTRHTGEITELQESQAAQDVSIADLLARMSAAEEQILSIIAAIQILDPTGDIGDIADTIAEMQQALLALQVTVNNHTTQINNILAQLSQLSAPYESRDLTGTITVTEFLTHIHDKDGVIKIGNFIQAAYTDPETLLSASAVLVCADVQTVLVRDTKPYAYGMPTAMLSGYAHSSVKTYIDLVVQAIADSAQYSLTPRSSALASHAWISTTQSGTVEQPPALETESHYGLLLSSMAIFGAPMFGGLDCNGYSGKLKLFEYEAPGNDLLLSDIVTNARYCIPDSFVFNPLSYPTNCLVKSLRVTPYVCTVKDAVNSAYPIWFTFAV